MIALKYGLEWMYDLDLSDTETEFMKNQIYDLNTVLAPILIGSIKFFKFGYTLNFEW